ncbi:hypothetical protein LguiB_031109 [Lonicera macranthoides]
MVPSNSILTNMAKKTNPSNKEKPKQAKTRRTPKKKPNPKSWFDFVNDDKLRLAIPVGPRFQADLPEWTGPLNNKSNSSKWLGTTIWPIKEWCLKNKGDVLGQGRPDFCLCLSPGSIECVKCHVLEKRMQLVLDLGPAFWRWKFDEMGEEVSKLWNLDEEKEFENLVRMNPTSQGKGFLKPALERLGSQSQKTIVSYYFNVYKPRQISALTRSGCMTVDTDDEASETPCSKVSRKKCLADNVSSYGCKYVKTRYLKGCR